MSSEWLKIEVSLPQKPEVIRIARQLKMRPETVCGWLIRFWGWASFNSVDGVVDGMASTDIDETIGLKGFAAALESVQWLKFDAEKNSLTIPNFTRHNGESAKKRALNSNRQAKWRNAHVDAGVDGAVDAHVDAHVDAASVTRGDKRREEPSNKQSSSKTTLQPGWWSTEKGIEETAKTLGINLGTKTYHELKTECFEKINGAKGNGKAKPEPKPAEMCSQCGGSLANGWTSMRGGRACNPCYAAYLGQSTPAAQPKPELKDLPDDIPF